MPASSLPAGLGRTGADPNSPAPLLTLDGIGKVFDNGPEVLRNVDLTLSSGDFVALIGPSGCGKSTLLRLVAGLTRPTSGTLKPGPGHADLPDRLSFVFQDATLLPWLNVLDNVALPLKLAGMEAAERRARARAYLDLVGLSDALERYPRQLSGGMKMRVSIARALTVDPLLLLLDEPFGALDEMTRDTLNEELLRLRERDAWTALFVTHSVAEAVFLSNRVVVMAANPGRVAAVIDVPLDYPRTADTRRTRAFGDLVVGVSEALHAAHRQGAGP